MKTLASIASLLILGAGVATTWAWHLATTPVTLDAPVVLEIARGARLNEIAKDLEARGVVTNAQVLRGLARLREADRTIRFGRHTFEGSLTPDQVLLELGRVPKPTLKVTIPEGYTWAEIGSLLEAEGLAEEEAWTTAVCDKRFLAKAQAPAEGRCAEGFLFPDTYHLEPGMSATAIADLMLGRFQTVWSELAEAQPPPEILSQGDASARVIRNRVVTLASIVEKETGAAEERGRIAGVFANRLRRKMLLQTDPTVIYGVLASGAAWDGNLTRAHLREPTPFNTYVNKGLPPGPICSPGRDALRAALAPEKVEALFFVAKGDGTHEFTSNLADHNRAVRRWQLGRP